MLDIQSKVDNQMLRRNKTRKRKKRLQRWILVGLCLFNIMVITGLINLAKDHNVTIIEEFISSVRSSPKKDNRVGSDYQGAENNQSNAKSFQNNTEWNLILVNATHKIPENYSLTLKQLKNDQAVDERIYPDLQNMMDAARSDGIFPMINSSYRTPQMQSELLIEKVEMYKSQGFLESEAENLAKRWVAVQGTSEHQVGLALDIGVDSNLVPDGSQSSDDVYKWFMDNCAEFGFILRYPEGKTDITGTEFEPWHYRYVGIEVAKEITEKGICLEEYLEE